MAYREHVETACHRSRTPASSSPAASRHRSAPRRTAAAVRRVGISIYGCSQDEAELFHDVAPRFGVTPTITEAAVSDTTIALAIGNRCISVDHKTRIANSTLRSLSEAGIAYISTRSTGHNHLDVDFARSVGISVEGVAYSPDSVADYTLMLMLMAVRNARSTIIRVEAHDFRLPDVRGKELGIVVVLTGAA